MRQSYKDNNSPRCECSALNLGSNFMWERWARHQINGFSFTSQVPAKIRSRAIWQNPEAFCDSYSKAVAAMAFQHKVFGYAKTPHWSYHFNDNYSMVVVKEVFCRYYFIYAWPGSGSGSLGTFINAFLRILCNYTSQNGPLKYIFKTKNTNPALFKSSPHLNLEYNK